MYSITGLGYWLPKDRHTPREQSQSEKAGAFTAPQGRELGQERRKPVGSRPEKAWGPREGTEGLTL